jgi:putative tricarboxylic transport membrane protein
MRTLTRSRDARAGLVAAVLGLGYLASAFTIEPDPSTTSVVGPRAAPIAIGVVSVVCAFALVVQALRSAETGGRDVPAQPDEQAGEEAASASGLVGLDRRQVVVSFVIFAAYVIAFIPLGYLLSTFLFLVAMTTYVDRRKIVRNCIFAAVFSPAVYVLFDYGLQVQLPSPGLLG